MLLLVTNLMHIDIYSNPSFRVNYPLNLKPGQDQIYDMLCYVPLPYILLTGDYKHIIYLLYDHILS